VILELDADVEDVEFTLGMGNLVSDCLQLA
jgi:hypothetical protein